MFGPAFKFTVGPVDFPDKAVDQKATGARFLNDVRGYSGTSINEVEHYCLDCTFRPWLDATGNLTAKLMIKRAGSHGKTRIELLRPDRLGRFRSRSTLSHRDTATITVTDAWGDTAAGSLTVPRG